MILLLARFWWLIPMVALAAAGTYFRSGRDHARAELAVATAERAQHDAVDSFNATRAKREKGTADATLVATLAAADARGAALGELVRQYAQNSLCPAEVRATRLPVPAGGSAPDPGGAGEAVAGTIPDLLGRAMEACTRDAARLDNAVEWAKSVE